MNEAVSQGEGEGLHIDTGSLQEVFLYVGILEISGSLKFLEVDLEILEIYILPFDAMRWSVTYSVGKRRHGGEGQAKVGWAGHAWKSRYHYEN
ncbi:hypothetical protein CRG98_046274 [Punica granatum]|uniref:Uncharacterized protein n=1 Tax=Punica granatum TaxID=22663 RepID=A0A2I0HNR5_PUNGR|nr:hypothetical protein CRG98_046274 [Punica granatum]